MRPLGCTLKTMSSIATLDRKQFHELVSPFVPRLYRAIFLTVRNEEDAKDLLQETMVRAFKNLHRYDRAQPVYPWLLTIGKNLSRNHFRKKETGNASLSEDWEIVGSYRGPEETAIRSETSREVFAALARLKPEQREILELKHFQDCSYQEIAEILGIPQGTVMSRLYYARKELARILEETR